MKHTPECLDYQMGLMAAYFKWRAKWPDYCVACSGAGEHRWYENAAPLGSGENWPMECGDVCEKCIGNGRCPRCGKFTLTTLIDGEDYTDAPCTSCGWNYDDACPPRGLEDPCECDSIESALLKKDVRYVDKLTDEDLIED